MTVTWIGIGGLIVAALIGSTGRFFLSGFVARRVGGIFPWGTLVVNVSGSFLVGVCAAYAEINGLSSHSDFWLVAVTGLVGSYTTVSSFSLQTRALFRDGELTRGFANIGLSLVLCIPATALGFFCAAFILGAPSA